MAVSTGTTWDIVLNDNTVHATGTSARAAYQSAIFGRAVIVDVREHAAARLPDRLAIIVSPAELRRWLSETLFTSVLVLDDDGVAAADVVARVAVGVPHVEVIDGGFAGWAAAGLPTA